MGALESYFYGSSWAEAQGIQVTVPYMTLKYQNVQNKNSLSKAQDQLKVAAVSNRRFNLDAIYPYYNMKQITFLNTEKECLDAVKQGAADITYLDSYMINYYFQDYRYRTLINSVIQHKHKVTLVTRAGDETPLNSQCCKSIASIDMSVMTEIHISSAEELCGGQ